MHTVLRVLARPVLLEPYRVHDVDLVGNDWPSRRRQKGGIGDYGDHARHAHDGALRDVETSVSPRESDGKLDDTVAVISLTRSH